MPTYMEVEARGWDNHRKVAHAADGFSSEHRDWDKDLQYGVQGGGNRVAPPGPTYFTGISMKAGSLSAGALPSGSSLPSCERAWVRTSTAYASSMEATISR